MKNDTISIRIKSNSSSADVTVPATTASSVEELKKSIRNALGQSASGRYLRLIHSGRLLAPDHAPLTNFRLKDGSVVHAVVAAAGVRGGHQAALSRPNNNNSRRRSRRDPRIGTGVDNDGLILSRNSDNDDNEDLEQGIERRGFDRLRAEGVTSAEIAALRTYFARQVDRFIQQRTELEIPLGVNSNSDSQEEDNDDPEATSRRRRMAMEDEWMELQGPNSEFRLNLNASNPLMTRRMRLGREVNSFDPSYNAPLGTDRDFIWGFVLGYFLGFVMMFWVWLPTLPHRQKLGILTGLCFHLGMSIVNKAAEEGK